MSKNINMKIKSGYRVYVNATLRGTFDDNDVEHQVYFYPSMSRKEVNTLIDDLNEDVSPVEDNLTWLWVYTDSASRTVQRQIEVIHNETGKLITPVMWFSTLEDSLTLIEE
jgi:hypothetical protein